ncbi:MAG: hypothetical protein V4591_05070 [Bdellovibrionota bacterium]
MNGNKLYKIYSHSDADGGIAAAIFSKFLHEKYAKYDWYFDIEPVNHITPLGEWNLKEISWPCAILDFTLHPSLLSEKFFNPKFDLEKSHGKTKSIPECYWIDHHPTGSNFPFLNETNTKSILPFVITKWDTSAISTPGLLRTHHEELELPKRLISEYEEFIDLAEIVDGALYASCEAAHDFSCPAVKLQTLFNANHPAIDRSVVYKRLAKQIAKNSSVEALFDSDFLYPSIILHEEQEHNKQLKAYKKATHLHGKVAYAKFLEHKDYAGLGRFIPYLHHEDAHYAIHLAPKGRGNYSISCGINPWNKPTGKPKHLGNYFLKAFSGGGHAFVAGGKVKSEELNKIDELIQFLNS